MTPDQFKSAMDGWLDYHGWARDGDVPGTITACLSYGGMIEGRWHFAADSEDVLAIMSDRFGLALIALDFVSIVYFRER